MSERYTLTISPELNGQRLDKALTALLHPHLPLSRARVQALLADGKVWKDGKAITSGSDAASEGAVYEVEAKPALTPSAAAPEELPLNIVYEDDDVIVINKDPGVVVHPAAGNYSGTLVNALLFHRADELSGIGGVQRPGIVHRLDKDTSGLMVVAKHDAAHQMLSQQFANRSLSRSYLAIVWGVPSPRVGVIDAPIGRSNSDRKKMAVNGVGKASVTHYEVLKVLAGGLMALVRCELETGRTHQIRVHMTYLGHPLVGDQTYGVRTAHRIAKLSEQYREAVTAFERQALHATSLHFISPKTGKMQQFDAPLPQDMQKLLVILEQPVH